MIISKKSLFVALALVFSSVFFIGCSSDDDTETNVFVGTWQVQEDCDGSADSYVIQITEAEGNEVNVFNLWNFADNIVGTVNGNDLTIPFQATGVVTYEGTASVSGNTMSINFKIDGDECTATGEK